MTTTPDHRHQQAWLALAESQSLVFSVKTPANAELVLSTYLGNVIVNMYTIVIGDELNTVSYIWKGDDQTTRVETKTPELLDPTRFVTLWVSWNLGKVELGWGRTPGLSRLLILEDDDPFEINAISLASQTTASWRVTPPEGRPYAILSLFFFFPAN